MTEEKQNEDIKNSGIFDDVRKNIFIKSLIKSDSPNIHLIRERLTGVSIDKTSVEIEKIPGVSNYKHTKISAKLTPPLSTNKKDEQKEIEDLDKDSIEALINRLESLTEEVESLKYKPETDTHEHTEKTTSLFFPQALDQITETTISGSGCFTTTYPMENL